MSQLGLEWLRMGTLCPQSACLGLQGASEPSPTPDRKTEAWTGAEIYPKSPGMFGMFAAGARPEPRCPDSWSGGFSALCPVLPRALPQPGSGGPSVCKPFVSHVSRQQALSPPGLARLRIYYCWGRTTSQGGSRVGGRGLRYPSQDASPQEQRRHAAPGPPCRCLPGSPGLCP